MHAHDLSLALIVKSSQVAFNKNKWQSHKYYMQIAKNLYKV